MPRRNQDDDDDNGYDGEISEDDDSWQDDIPEDLADLMEEYEYDDIDEFLADYPEAYEWITEDYLDYLDEADVWDDEDFYVES